jgi:pimeloyl-ACP methyl ester carboxylesterase/DNA-binding CsgD family transcriptional regulator
VGQRVRFCSAPDGVQIAFAVHGSGPPIVRSSTWLTHLEFDWDSPIWRHWLEALGAGHTVVRYDQRGSGLSDRSVDDLSMEAGIGDLEAVVGAAGVDRFALLGVSGGGPVAIAYAVRHPERVSHLVLYGTYGRGRFLQATTPQQLEEVEALISIVRVGWDRPNPGFRRAFTTLFVPDATPEQTAWFDEMQRVSATGEMAARLRRARGELDVTGLAPLVRVPTLVLHARDDAVVPFEEGRRLAAVIPDARFVPLEGRNHILLEDEPAWGEFVSEVRSFIGTRTPAASSPDGAADLSGLSPRELEVLELVAAGADNEQIASRLYLSVRTVERHLSNVYAKLGLSGKSARAAAAARFSRRGASDSA